MKVLIDHPDPFLLAHGGMQQQIESTKAALEKLGIEVEFVRWWDERQQGDLIHFFGRATSSYLQQAKIKGVPVVLTSSFSVACNRSPPKLWLQALLTQTLRSLGGARLTSLLGWDRYHECAYNVVGLRAEQKVLERVYGVPADRISVVPLGVADVFLNSRKMSNARGEHLITIGTIREIKRSVELAEAARSAEVPILFVGKPYSEASDYWRRFQRLVDQRCVKYQPHVDSAKEMVNLLQQARGLVMMSDYENWCLAAHEAAAVGLPLLLPDLPWSRERFGRAADYFPKGPRRAAALRRFYEESPSLPPPKVDVPSWDDTARRLKEVYAQVLRKKGSDLH